MTVPLKLKLLPRAVLKGKVGARFPAKVNASSPLVINTVGGGYTFSIDINALSGMLPTPPGGGNVVGTPPTIVNDIALWKDTGGTQLLNAVDPSNRISRAYALKTTSTDPVQWPAGPAGYPPPYNWDSGAARLGGTAINGDLIIQGA